MKFTFHKLIKPFLFLLLLGTAYLGQTQNLYDANGNLIKDPEKGIDTILYNHLNLVEEVVMKDKGTTRYSYDALGNKRTKTVIPTGGRPTTHHYIDGVEYEGETLQLFATDEGRVVANQDGSHSYEYFLEDQLGNHRVSFTKGAEGRAQLTQSNNYYTYGGIHPASSYTSGIANPYLYNGIEQESELGLDVYTAFYRTLDPSIGRWLQIDPKSELMYAWSPYNSNMGNPIKFSDPKGDIAFIPLLIIGAKVGWTGYKLYTAGEELGEAVGNVGDIVNADLPEQQRWDAGKRLGKQALWAGAEAVVPKARTITGVVKGAIKRGPQLVTTGKKVAMEVAEKGSGFVDGLIDIGKTVTIRQFSNNDDPDDLFKEITKAFKRAREVTRENEARIAESTEKPTPPDGAKRPSQFTKEDWKVAHQTGEVRQPGEDVAVPEQAPSPQIKKPNNLKN